MERTPKYVFNAESWKPNLADDGRPSNNFESVIEAVKEWWKDDQSMRDNSEQKPNFFDSVKSLDSILRATNARNFAQKDAWFESRTPEEIEEMKREEAIASAMSRSY